MSAGTSSYGSRCNPTYKPSRARSAVKDRSAGAGWLGPLEHRILQAVLELGLERFTPRDVQHRVGADRRRIHDALKRLASRGFVERVSRGLYRVAVDISRLVAAKVRNLRSSVKDRPRARGVGGSAVGMSGTRADSKGDHPLLEGPLFDNVRGYLRHSGRYVHGDRGRVLSWRDLGLFGRVSYCEVLYRVRGQEFPGCMVVYSNEVDGGGFRVEWRPPSGFVGRNGVASSLRMFWEAVLVLLRSLLELVLREAPLDVLRRALSVIYSRAGQLVCAG